MLLKEVRGEFGDPFLVFVFREDELEEACPGTGVLLRPPAARREVGGEREILQYGSKSEAVGRART